MMMRKRIMRSKFASFALLIGGLICSNRKRASLSLSPLVLRNGGASSSQDDSIILDWKMKITSDLLEAPEERFFGRHGFSAVGFLGPESIEEVVEGNESSGDSVFEEE